VYLAAVCGKHEHLSRVLCCSPQAALSHYRRPATLSGPSHDLMKILPLSSAPKFSPALAVHLVAECDPSLPTQEAVSRTAEQPYLVESSSKNTLPYMGGRSDCRRSNQSRSESS